MPIAIRSVLACLLVGCILPPIAAEAQAPNPKAAPPAGPIVTGNLTGKVAQVVAIVNGDKITRGDLLNFLSRYPVPPLSHEQIYNDAVETLVNTRLIGQYLSRQQIAVPPEKVNDAVAQLERDLRADGRELQAALRENGQSMDELRREYLDRIRWVEFLKRRATDAELRQFAASHKELVAGTQVKASHIYLAVDDDAPPAEKEKVRQKLLGIKRDIDDQKITFTDAANKYSEDPANAKNGGGDIGYFGLANGVVEDFARAAFALKPGVISDPVETDHGLHLILVTDRKEGNPVDFEQQKPFILQLYAADMQKQILTAERENAEKTHSIEVKPMPPDLFPPPPSGNAPGAAPSEPAKPK